MINNYFKIAWRTLLKNKLFSSINILGLSLGIALCFLIMLFVQDELSFDKFNKNSDRIARVVFGGNVNGGKISEAGVMAPVAAAMKKDFPEVEDATRILRMGEPKITYQQNVFKNDKLAFVDPNFFSVFTMPLIEGDSKNVLAQANTIVVSETLAKKYFGSGEAVGKVISINGDTGYYKITGVMKDMPSNSHFQFDLLASLTGFKDATNDSWMYGSYYTYLLLKPGADLTTMQGKLPGMVEKYMGPQIQQQMGLSLEQFRTKGNQLGFTLQPLTSIHLYSHTNTEFEPGGNASYVYIFGGIALFMLVVACINFVNLSTAGASKRAKEVGIKKVIGSERGQLVKQFLSESVLISLFALLIAAVLVWLALPVFNEVSGKQLHFDIKPVLAFIGLGLAVGILAGIYPAFYLSSFKPIAVLKGKFVTGNRTFGLRKGLVVFQFFISVMLIIGTIVVYQQMKFIQNKDLGFKKEQVLVLPNSWALGKNEQVYKNEMLNDPRIENATTSWYKPAGPSNFNNALAFPQGNDQLLLNGIEYHVDENYIPTLGIQMATGRNFSKEFATDSTGIILNETAVRALGWNNETAINKIIIRQNSERGNNTPFHIIGVVKNFNFKSLHESISPLMMSLQPEGGLIFKVKTTDVAGLLSSMKTKWESYKTGEPFTYSFLDELFEKAYAAEQKTSTLLNIFAVITIFVSCLGLFGLVTYTVEQKTKEIGIRKVLGASVPQVSIMVSKEFIKLVLIACVIAFPLAWYAMHQWLQDFAFRINISWTVFVIAALMALSIALLTVGFKAVKAALSNPVRSLRTE
jgi:putative ABC transport system permease protein